MAWVRVNQSGAESGSKMEVQGLSGNDYSIVTNQFYTGSRCFRVNGYSNPIGFTSDLGNAARVGFMFRHSGGTTDGSLVGCVVSGVSILFIYNPNIQMVAVRAGYVQNDNEARYPISGILVPSLNVFNTWLHVAATFYLSETNGFVSLYVDGLPVASWTGNTAVYNINSPIPRTKISGIYASGGVQRWPATGTGLGWSDAYIDDIYVDKWDGSPGLVDAPPPLRRFLYAFPNGAGAYSQWTPSANSNWQNVDEIPPNNDSDYNKATAAGLKDTYQYGDITLPPDHAIRAVIPTAYARKTDAGSDSRIRLVSRTGSTEVISDPLFLPVSYGFVSHRLEKQPDGISPWTETAFNSAEFGIESAGEF